MEPKKRQVTSAALFYILCCLNTNLLIYFQNSPGVVVTITSRSEFLTPPSFLTWFSFFSQRDLR